MQDGKKVTQAQITAAATTCAQAIGTATATAVTSITGSGSVSGEHCLWLLLSFARAVNLGACLQADWPSRHPRPSTSKALCWPCGLRANRYGAVTR